MTSVIYGRVGAVATLARWIQEVKLAVVCLPLRLDLRKSERARVRS